MATKKVTEEPKEKKVVKAVKAEKTEKAPVKKPVAKKTDKSEDTGSVDFQIKNFSDKISSLSKHLKTHAHDFDSRRGLLIMVGKRRRLLNYVKKNDLDKYQELAATLKLKK